MAHVASRTCPQGKSFFLLYGVILLIGIYPLTSFHADDPYTSLKRDFHDPPPRSQARPLWFWNGAVTTYGIHEQIEKIMEVGYGGFTVLPAPPMPVQFYLSEEYLLRYQEAVEKAADLDLKVTLYPNFAKTTYAAGANPAAIRS